VKFELPIPVAELADRYGLKIIGNRDAYALGINEIHKVTAGDITFVDNEKYYQKSLHSAASIIIIDKEVDCPEGKVLLIADQPFRIYEKIVTSLKTFLPLNGKPLRDQVIDDSAIIEKNVIIGHNVKIGPQAYIQAGAIIHSDVIIGARVEIQSGAIIGTDAFYFKKEDGRYHKWTSCGRVIIEDDVVIGAGCTINKGVSGDTIIGEGSKLDSQVHIGHGAVIGKHCLLAAQVGIGGKTIIGNHVVLYGQVGIAQNLTIGDGAVILAKSGVSKNLQGGKTYFGYPATEAREKYKELATLRGLTSGHQAAEWKKA
jgi:UDP-3-O-[3-hydroxymyristoyl] glucosamine N-acyltransferase